VSTLNVDKVDPNTGTALEIGSSGDTITIPSGATIVNSGTATGFGGDNTPYFYGRMASDLTIAAQAEVKVTGMTTNEIDPDSVWDGTTFTPAVAGYYFLHANVQISWGSAGNDGNRAQSMWFFNGADLSVNNIFLNDSASTALMAAGSNSILKYFDADDYMELYVYTDNSGATSGTAVSSYTHMEGFKLIG